MSNLFEDTPTKELSWLLMQIQQREAALPDFQRDFVWEPAATQELIISIANNYPAGSLLAIRNTNNYFASREFEGAPQLDGSKPTYLILDGQQRLTSLFQAFYGKGDYRYFIRVKGLLDGQEIDDEDVLFHVRASAQRGQQGRDLKKYATLEGQAEDLVMPLSTLFGGQDGYLGWADAISERIEEKEVRKALKQKMLDVRKRVISNIESYKFPVVLLSDQTPADAVCTIFETLNRTGVKLSVYDLLAARFWPENVKLRDLWQSACSRFPIVKDFEIEPYYLLQIIALLRTDLAPSCKRKDVLQLSAPKVAEIWEKAVRGLVSALEILRDDCGVLIPKWLPYNTIVIPFGAVLARHPLTRGLQAGEIRQKLVRWFWCSVFGQSYENSPNSQAARDLTEVAAWVAGGSPPPDLASFSFDSSALYEVSPKQRALYRGVISLILSKHPRDFHEVKPLTKAIMEEDKVDDHHVFPDAYLRDEGIKETKRRDCILNRTLIDRATNQSLNRRNPKDYFLEMKERLGDNKFNTLLASHYLPAGDDSPLLTNNYTDFLEWRCKRIGQAIQEGTGGTVDGPFA
jgi:hypothetical protein